MSEGWQSHKEMWNTAHSLVFLLLTFKQIRHTSCLGMPPLGTHSAEIIPKEDTEQKSSQKHPHLAFFKKQKYSLEQNEVNWSFYT